MFDFGWREGGRGRGRGDGGGRARARARRIVPRIRRGRAAGNFICMLRMYLSVGATRHAMRLAPNECRTNCHESATGLEIHPSNVVTTRSTAAWPRSCVLYAPYVCFKFVTAGAVTAVRASAPERGCVTTVMSFNIDSRIIGTLALVTTC